MVESHPARLFVCLFVCLPSPWISVTTFLPLRGSAVYKGVCSFFFFFFRSLLYDPIHPNHNSSHSIPLHSIPFRSKSRIFRTTLAVLPKSFTLLYSPFVLPPATCLFILPRPKLASSACEKEGEESSFIYPTHFASLHLCKGEKKEEKNNRASHLMGRRGGGRVMDHVISMHYLYCEEQIIRNAFLSFICN